MIYVDNRQNKLEVTEELVKLLENVTNTVLEAEEVKVSCEISIILVDNEEIRNLNREYRNIDRETDVLSFPMLDYEAERVYKEVYALEEHDESDFDGGELVLGDMALSLEKAFEQSVEYGHTFMREVAYLTVHSILHLLGYDHMKEDEKLKMRAVEESILEKLMITRE
jgi:probable rRNA maturation factor